MFHTKTIQSILDPVAQQVWYGAQVLSITVVSELCASLLARLAVFNPYNKRMCSKKINVHCVHLSAILYL